jgi:hypothetical protein
VVLKETNIARIIELLRPDAERFSLLRTGVAVEKLLTRKIAKIKSRQDAL